MIRTTQIITPAPGGILCTLDDVKAEIGATGTADDAYLTRRIQVASSSIAAYCGRSFGREDVRDTFLRVRPDERERLGKPLVLSRGLIESVSAVAAGYLGVTLNSGRWSVDAVTGEVFHLSYTGLQDTSWPCFPVTVDYTAGWYLPDDPACNLPEVVQFVAVDMVVAAYYARERDPGIRNESVPDVGTIRYTDAPFAMDPRILPFKVFEF